MGSASEQPAFVLHCDVDAFFVQVEQQRDPSLQGRAVAIQQHQDIIAANAAAKAAGVTKHMAPAEARRLLHPVGGRVAHVHCAAGGRVSYQPYREASARLMKLLKALPWAAVVEKASIDEAYILLAAPLDDALGPLGGEGGAAGGEVALAQLALQRAQEAKAAVQHQLGLTVSVGAAPNRLLAKLASAAAKPDGVRLVPDQSAALQLLSQIPAWRLPGYGGKAAEAFERYGVQAATELQRFSQRELEQLFGLRPAAAAQLEQWCRGVDETEEKPPPKTLSVQMSLTPQLLAMHPSHGGPAAVSASGGRAGVLEPLVTGKPDFRQRVRQLMAAMGLDLVERVREDAAEERRWPKTLSASLRAFGVGRDQAFTTRSSAFPSQGLQHTEPQQGQQAQQQQQQRQQEAAPLGPLEEAVVHALERLVHQIAAGIPSTATVVELRLAATNFASAAAAAAAGPITRFFAVASRPRQQAQQQAQQAQAQEQAQQDQAQEQAQQAQQAQQARDQEEQRKQGLAETPAGKAQLQQQAREPAGPWQGAPGPSAGQHMQQQQQQPPPPQQQPPPPPQQHGEALQDTVDLGSIDVREQQRILQQLERQRQQQRGGAGASKPAGGGGSGAGGKRRGQAAAGKEPDAKQPKIMAFFKK